MKTLTIKELEKRVEILKGIESNDKIADYMKEEINFWIKQTKLYVRHFTSTASANMKLKIENAELKGRLAELKG